jgi:hypothetical protein
MSKAKVKIPIVFDIPANTTTIAGASTYFRSPQVIDFWSKSPGFGQGFAEFLRSVEVDDVRKAFQLQPIAQLKAESTNGRGHYLFALKTLEDALFAAYSFNATR